MLIHYGVKPLSNILSNSGAPAGTPVWTDQGIVMIEDIDPTIHTINMFPVLYNVRQYSPEDILIKFEANSVEFGFPTALT